MALLDEISKKITNAGQNVVKGTKDFAEVTRLNSQISDEQKNITGIYTQIGERFYEKFGTDLDVLGAGGNDFLDDCAALKEAFDKIEQYQNEILVIRGVIVCKQCGAELAMTASFCSDCGAAAEKPVVAAVVEETPQKKFCVGCGAELSENAAFCTSCGQKVPE